MKTPPEPSAKSVPFAPVRVRDETVPLPTYLPEKPDRNPMFFENRVYQGSSGKVYPLPFIDRIAETPTPHPWRVITLENAFLEVEILPEIGGRIHRLRDKQNGYDAIYHQRVIKPALVGLAGPWMSGGVEFNWPQHHRPSTFMPAQVEIEHEPGGAITVWLGEHEPMNRLHGLHGIRLAPMEARLEIRVRLFNRTDAVQTFLWWTNIATEVHARYQSFFPPDVTAVADHAKRAMSRFPECTGTYYGVDYGSRATADRPAIGESAKFVPDGTYPPNDLRWYANIPVPTSYMCLNSRYGFMGGYDHRAEAGLIHYAPPRISPGKKQWTWGNHAFGYAWDRHLTDPGADGVHRPYIELMAGVFTDNQPDFSFLMPGEGKAWSQFLYPIREIGSADYADPDVALTLREERGHLLLNLVATHDLRDVEIAVNNAQEGVVLHRLRRSLHPQEVTRIKLPLAECPPLHHIALEMRTATGERLLHFSPPSQMQPPTDDELAVLAAKEPPLPSEVESTDRLFGIGQHLDQYRHATRLPELYWEEALRRDAGDLRCNLAMGKLRLRQADYERARDHLEAARTRAVHDNPNPADGEVFFQLGVVLRHLGETGAARLAFEKAMWNQAWQGPSALALAELAAQARDRQQALAFLGEIPSGPVPNLRAVLLRVLLLREAGDSRRAEEELTCALACAPLDPGLRWLAGKAWLAGNAERLDLAFDLARAGYLAEALSVLEAAKSHAEDGTAPIVAYACAWLHEQMGKPDEAREARRRARVVPRRLCFPSRLDEEHVLTQAIRQDPDDPLAPFLRGLFLYDRRRHREAIRCWERAVRNGCRDSVLWRCLGIAYHNIACDPQAARRAYARARRLAPEDARLVFEADQLEKRLGRTVGKRLAFLRHHRAAVDRRDDLSLELAALLNQSGQPAEALALLRNRTFQPWEGGEGRTLGQYVRACLLLGRAHLQKGEVDAAISVLQSALTPPENIGEAAHPLANQSPLHYWLGLAYEQAGKPVEARNSWEKAASFSGDFQTMQVVDFSALTYFSARSLERLGEEAAARARFDGMRRYADALEKTPAKIDYFATSLPDLLLFNEDLSRRQLEHARLLRGIALLGLGDQKEAARLFQSILRENPGHADAADFFNECIDNPAT